MLHVEVNKTQVNNIIFLHVEVNKNHVNIIMLHIEINKTHVNIILFYVDINMTHVNIIMLHVDIIHIACTGQTYDTILWHNQYTFKCRGSSAVESLVSIYSDLCRLRTMYLIWKVEWNNIVFIVIASFDLRYNAF